MGDMSGRGGSELAQGGVAAGRIAMGRGGRRRAGRMNGRGRHSVRVAFGVTGIRRGWPSV